MTFDIRPALNSDRQGWDRLFDMYLAFYDTRREAALKDVVWSRIMHPDRPMHCLVAVAPGGDIAGIANFLYHPTFWEERDSCYLNDLFVDPNYRGQQAGKALIEAVQADARRNSAPEFYWLTGEDNTTARRLYDRLATRSPFVHYVMPEA